MILKKKNNQTKKNRNREHNFFNDSPLSSKNVFHWKTVHEEFQRNGVFLTYLPAKMGDVVASMILLKNTKEIHTSLNNMPHIHKNWKRKEKI